VSRDNLTPLEDNGGNTVHLHMDQRTRRQPTSIIKPPLEQTSFSDPTGAKVRVLVGGISVVPDDDYDEGSASDQNATEARAPDDPTSLEEITENPVQVNPPHA